MDSRLFKSLLRNLYSFFLTRQRHNLKETVVSRVFLIVLTIHFCHSIYFDMLHMHLWMSIIHFVWLICYVLQFAWFVTNSNAYNTVCYEFVRAVSQWKRRAHNSQSLNILNQGYDYRVLPPACPSRNYFLKRTHVQVTLFTRCFTHPFLNHSTNL